MAFYQLPKIIGKDKKPPFGARINWHHPLSQGLVGAWLLNEGGGKSIWNLARSEINTGFNALWQSDKLYFDGINKYVDTTVSPFDFDSSDIRTVCLKFWVDAAYGNVLVGNLETSNNYKGWEINVSSSFGSRPSIYINNTWNTNAILVSANYIMQTGILYNLVVTYDGSSLASGISFYIDGKKYANLAPVKDLLTLSSKSINKLRYGVRVDNNEDLKGSIYHAFIWNRKLSDGEIASLYVNAYQMFWPSVWDAYFVPAAAPPPTGGKSIFGYDSIFHAGGIIQT